MTYKEWNAVIMVAGAVAIAIWVTVDALTNPVTDLQVIAARLVWAIGFTVLFNILAVIGMTIVVSIARRQEFKDERADERDVAISAKSMRNAYFVASITGLGALLIIASAADPAIAIYVLFGGLLLAGAVDAASRLVYYWLG